MADLDPAKPVFGRLFTRGSPRRPLKDRALRGLTIGGAYLLCLMIRSLLPAPGSAPGSLIEPEAGLAVAALALVGRSNWPAVLVVSLGYWTIAGFTPAAALTMAVGATVHAVVGSSAIRRRLLDRDEEWSSRDMWYCFRMAGLLASAVYATIVATLLGTVGEPAHLEFIDHWLASFSGSILGVTLVVPPLILLAQPRGLVPLRSVLRVAVPLLVIATLLSVAHFLHHRLEVDRSRGRTENMVDGVHLQAALLLRNLGATAEAFERYMVASEDVTAEEFSSFARPYLDRPGVRRVEWIPGRTASGAFPVGLVAPLAGNRHLVGVDRRSDAEAIASYTSAVSAGRRGLYGSGNGQASQRDTLVVVHPVFHPDFVVTSASLQERLDSMRGVIAIVADRAALFQQIDAAANAAGLMMSLADSVGSTLHHSVGFDGLSVADGDRWTREVTFGGQPMRLTLASPNAIWHDPGTSMERLLHATITFATLLAAFGLIIGATQQAALSSSDRRFVMLLENLNGMVYRRSHGDGSHFDFASEGSRLLLGVAPDRLMRGRATYDELVHPEDLEAAKSSLEAALATGESFRTEYRMRHSDGEWRWVWDHGSGVYDSEGQLHHIEGFIADTTDRRAAEEELHRLTDELEARVTDRTRDLERANALLARQQDELKTVLNNLVECVVQIDGDGVIRSTNPALTRILGYQPEEVIGRNVSMLMPEPTRTEHDSYLSRYFRTGEARVVGFRREVEGLHKSGRKVMIELAVNEYHDRGRSYFTGILRDIGEQKRTEQERARIVATLNGVLQAAYEVAIIATTADGRITLFNSGAERMLGYSADEVTGTHTPLIFHLPEELEARAGELASVLGRRVTGDDVLAAIPELEHSELGEWTWLHKDGSHIPVSLVVTAMRDEDGEVVGFVSIAQNITRRRRMMKDLADARDASDSANQAKSAFLATMSHEIRTPMNGILGTVDILLRASLTPRQLELAGTIHESAASLLGIIDDILDFSKIEAGRLDARLEPASPAIVVEDACVALQPVAARNEVELIVFADPLLPASILVDSLRLRQIVTNLVSNAIKFSAGRNEAGRVRVAVVPDSGDILRLTVSDNGVGMTQNEIARLFVPFSQADGSTTRRFGGTGLGLSIVKRLVEMMDGMIEVESVPGSGSTFTVRLPAQPCADPAAGPTPPSLGGISVAVVAGDPAEARDWIRHLEHAGASARSHRDLDTALSASARNFSSESVVLFEGGHEVAAGLASLHGTLPRLVRIGGSEQRLPHRERPGVIHLGGVITGRALVSAVAAACGRISPETDPGELLPPYPGGEAVTPEEAEAAGRLILVAEDNDLNRRVIRLQLTTLGYSAEFAENGTAALDLWRSGRYGLLLTDLHMPGLDGYELTAAIRAEDGERKPIVVLTANALSGEEDRCLAAGMDAYLAKPVPLELLHETLDRWLPALPISGGHPVNPSTLATLLGTDDVAVVQDFLQDFRRSVAEEIPAMVRALTDGDAAAAQASAHRLKSIAKAAGAARLADACTKAERAAADPQGRNRMLAAVVPVQEAGREIINWFEEGP